MSDYSTSFTVEQSAEEVYAAVLNVSAWWTGEIEGRADEVGGEFAYRHLPQHYSLQRVSELEPGRRVVWQVVDSRLAFVSEPSEWTGSQIVFDIAAAGSDPEHVGDAGSDAEHVRAAGTELRFTHVGLVPDVECFGACSTAWRHYVNGSLRSLITTGEGLPDPW
ncbi:SRPBCC domain-containing protein [Kribbella sp. NPDC051718]|uniref:SRPBCC domain-containing protein n=1 Tax=Kribbella sp. NPDC051718 TaxID=3155168 RepID=UPI003434708A